MEVLVALLAVAAIMAAGDIVSNWTKAFVPSVFVAAVLFLIGFWTILPEDVISVATLSTPFASAGVYILITHMGTMMDVKELLKQWKTVLISLAGIIGIIVFLLLIGSLVVGREAAIVGAPPLTGGIVAALIMKEAAEAVGNNQLAVLAILVYVVQGFIGYPLTSILLRKETNRLLTDYRAGQVLEIQKEEESLELPKRKLINIPEKYNTTYVVLLRLIFVAFLAGVFTSFVNENIFKNPSAISPYVTCLVFGVIGQEIGILNSKPLEKANAFGWFIFAMMAFVFEGLNTATPDLIVDVAGTLILVVLIGVAGMVIFSLIAGKVFKESPYMAMCIALNALYGFPPNFILTQEAVKNSSEDEEERQYLSDLILPKMLIGGFTSVTIVSVIVGGIFANLI